MAEALHGASEPRESTDLFGKLFHSTSMKAVFCDVARVQAMLDVEAALARAEGRLAVIPAECVGPIVACCRAEEIDFERLRLAIDGAGNSAIPLVKMLTERVRARDVRAAGFVHWGATSQDIMDSGLVLQLRAALVLIEEELARLIAAVRTLVLAHRHTPMIGRTWLQQALPVTFGLKAAGWLDALLREHEKLLELRQGLALQFGGAAGTLASLAGEGDAVTAALGKELGLIPALIPWHAARDRIAEPALRIGILVGSLGKIARDLSLLMQTEVGEVLEPAAPGKGGSSTMPHKRNPVACAVVLAAAMRVPPLVATVLTAMVQEHERGLGGWHAEWETVPEIFLLASGALEHLANAIEHLEVRPLQMRANLDRTRGLVMAEAVTMALGEKIGRMTAHELVEHACQRALAGELELREVLAEIPEVQEHLPENRLDEVLDPLSYLGCAQAMIDRVLAADVSAALSHG